jgi:hypothetical protein
MKAGFSLTKRFVPTFNGNASLNAADQLVAVLSMPVVEDIFAILERLSAAGVAKEDEPANISLARATNIAKEAGIYIPKYVKFENAEDFTVDDVIKYPPYFPLATELLFALVNFAQPNETDVKNS